MITLRRRSRGYTPRHSWAPAHCSRTLTAAHLRVTASEPAGPPPADPPSPAPPSTPGPDPDRGSGKPKNTRRYPRRSIGGPSLVTFPDLITLGQALRGGWVTR